jgi:acyl carrier protein
MRVSIEDVSEKIENLITEQTAHLDEKPRKKTILHEDLTLTELEIDSLGIVEIIFELEEAFDIEISYNANDADNGKIDTIGDLGKLVWNLANDDRKAN